MITMHIIRHILNDQMVVADLTDYNANVFYELALRHAFRKPVVQMIHEGQRPPFDVGGLRTVFYELSLDGASRASEQVRKQMAAALASESAPESPVSIAARLEDLTRTRGGQAEPLLEALLDQVDALSKSVADGRNHLWRPDDFQDLIPPFVEDRLEGTLQRYAREIDLLQAVRQAGVIGLHKRREGAIRASLATSMKRRAR